MNALTHESGNVYEIRRNGNGLITFHVNGTLIGYAFNGSSTESINEEFLIVDVALFGSLGSQVSHVRGSGFTEIPPPPPVEPDSDNDGFTDVAEKLAGTDLSSGASFPTFNSIEATANETQASIRWQSAAGITCGIEMSGDLQNWRTLESLPGDGTEFTTLIDFDSLAVVPDSANPARCLFLRLRYGAEDAASPVYGRTWSINRVHIPAKSDRRVGAVGHRPTIWLGALTNTAGTGSSYTTNLQGSTFSAAGLEAVHGPSMLQVLSGPQEGSCYAITASNASTLWLDEGSWNADGVSAMPAGTKVAIIPQWTVDAQLGTVPNGTEVHLFDRNSSGINNAPTESLTYYEFTDANGLNKGWWDGQTKVEQVLSADEAYLIRNSSNTAMIHTQIGEVSSAGMVRLIPSSTGERDHHVALNSALAVNLGDLSSLAKNGDTLYLYNDTKEGYNNASTTAATFYEYVDSNGQPVAEWWQGGTRVDETIQLVPGLGAILRTAPFTNNEDRMWKGPKISVE